MPPPAYMQPSAQLDIRRHFLHFFEKNNGLLIYIKEIALKHR